MNVQTMLTPHIAITRGTHGVTCDIRTNSGIILGYGFAELAQPATQTEYRMASAVALSAALAQIACDAPSV